MEAADFTDEEIASQLLSDLEQKPKFVAHKLSVREMMALTFVCAVAISLVNEFQVLGTLALFGVAFIWSLASASYVKGSQARFINEVIWGCLLPIACLMTDPIVFALHGGGYFGVQIFGKHVPEVPIGIYLFLGWQMLNMAASWFIAGASPSVRAWFAGTFLVGAIFAGGLGLILIPLSLLGLTYVIGIIGFTPLITAYIYASRTRRYWRASHSSLNRLYFALAGMVGAIILPAIFSITVFTFSTTAL